MVLSVGRGLRSGWVPMPKPVRALIVAAAVLGAAALAAAAAGAVMTGGTASWLVTMGWAVSGMAAVCGTLAAGLLRAPGSAVRGAWLMWTAASVCWVAGAVYRLAVTSSALSPVAGCLWLAFAVLSMASYARRLPRAVIFGIFLLDAIPVILLIVAIDRLLVPVPPGTPVVPALFLSLYPALFGLCAANAVQMAGIHRDLRSIPASVWLFTMGFCLMGLAALVWAPAVVITRSVTGHPADGLWTLGLLLIAAAALTRAFRLTGALVLPPVEKESGPHALPPAAAVLGLIILLTLVPADLHLLIQVFVLASAVTLFCRVYLIRREDVRLLRALVRSQEAAETAALLARRRAERLRLLADVTSRLKSPMPAELMQATCDAARELIGARYAAFGLADAGGHGFSHFLTSGMTAAAHDQLAGQPDVPQLLRTLVGPGAPVRISEFSRHPAAAVLPAPPPPLDGFLGVPVRVDTSRGVLCLTGKEGGFDEDDETLAQLLAANAGSALVSAELYAESQAQQELLTTQNEQLRELDQMKDEFIAVVSHELRTPLTSIIGYLELMEDAEESGLARERRKFTTERRKFTTVMHRNADRLLRLVGDLLFLAGLQTGELAIEHGEADLPELARSAIETARSAAERKHISLTCAATEVPGVPGDPGRLGQLLDNLLSNALKFTPEEGEVALVVGVQGRSAVISVSDNGMGMSVHEQQHIFERFFRTELATDQAIQGLGLGLTIVKAIVDAHNGSISVHSQPGQGTTFRVRLPLAQAPPGRAGTGPAGAGVAGSGAPDPVTMAEQGRGGRLSPAR
ncbi:MAG TPA: GAF domain-containing sensor histidine kinase [Streptosporangiaceae bacterium]